MDLLKIGGGLLGESPSRVSLFRKKMREKMQLNFTDMFVAKASGYGG